MLDIVINISGLHCVPTLWIVIHTSLIIGSLFKVSKVSANLWYCPTCFDPDFKIFGFKPIWIFCFFVCVSLVHPGSWSMYAWWATRWELACFTDVAKSVETGNKRFVWNLNSSCVTSCTTLHAMFFTRYLHGLLVLRLMASGSHLSSPHLWCGGLNLRLKHCQEVGKFIRSWNELCKSRVINC